jgi:hypothetical protein
LGHEWATSGHYEPSLQFVVVLAGLLDRASGDMCR